MGFNLMSIVSHELQALYPKVGYDIDQTPGGDETPASLTTCILTLIMLMSTVEIVALLLCTVCAFDPGLIEQNIFWNEEEIEKETEKERSERIVTSLNESVWGERSLHASPCSICLCDFQCGEVVVRSGSATRCCCVAIFHKECLHHWLQRNSTCPYCREELLKPI